MARRLARTVIVGTGDAMHTLLAGTVPSDDDAALVTNPEAWEDGGEADAPTEASAEVVIESEPSGGEDAEPEAPKPRGRPRKTAG